MDGGCSAGLKRALIDRYIAAIYISGLIAAWSVVAGGCTRQLSHFRSVNFGRAFIGLCCI